MRSAYEVGFSGYSSIARLGLKCACCNDLSLEGLLESLIRHEAKMDVREMGPLFATTNYKRRVSQKKGRFGLVKQLEGNPKRRLKATR
jgi:hypothetical protein